MTAHDQIRAMLDQLMGTGRNGENNRFQVKFSDPKVCKSFLLSCCPHEILSSTRMDLGECPKIHDLALRADFEKASQHKDYYYDIDAMEHLQAFIADCDRRTELAKQRLAETQEELSAEVAAKANKVHELAEQIGKKLARAEVLGAEGLVEESMKLMEEIEDLRKKKSAAEGEYRNSMPASSYQQQKLRVCEVCSAYLGIHDNDRRLADHFGGKLHLGFIKIREKLSELEKTVEQRKQQKRQELKDRDRDREERVRDRERGGGGSGGGGGGGGGLGGGLGGGGGGSRERDRDRDRERSRRRTRSRSRPRSGKRGTRSRSKSRSTHSSRSTRSRSRGRRSHSRSHSSRQSGERGDRRSRSKERHAERAGERQGERGDRTERPRKEQGERRRGEGDVDESRPKYEAEEKI